MPDFIEDRDGLRKKLRVWLDGQGYPLEFTTANVFRRNAFFVSQGAYVRHADSENPREIDLTAQIDASERDYLIRVYHVVECKSSRDKPWVVFTTSGKMGQAACVAQTIASHLGSAILWKEAGLERLHRMSLFETPDRYGFNGRQAFSNSNGKDCFYDAMRSVTSLSTLLVQQYDDHRSEGDMPEHAVVAFPLIVVDGKLFEAYFDADLDDVRLDEVDRIRCHWDDAPAWWLHATIDIVTFSGLDSFVQKRNAEVHELLAIMKRSRDEIAACFADGTIDSLSVTEGSRGVVGIHPLFREVGVVGNGISCSKGVEDE